MDSTPAWRPLTAEDATAILRLQTAYLEEVGVSNSESRGDVLHRLLVPGADLARDSLGVVVGGELVGFSAFRNSEGPRLWGMVARPYRRRGIGTALMAWGVGRARQQPGIDSVHVGTDAGRAEAHDLYRAFGFGEIRTFYTMVHADPAMVVAPVFPPGVSWRNDIGGDEALELAIALHDRAFVDHWDFHPIPPAAMAHLLDGPGATPGLSLYAFLDGEPIALSLCSLEAPVGFVSVLGTAPRGRGRGVASALLRQSMVELASRGATRVELHVDAANPTGAVRLYENAGMAVASTFRLFELKLT